MLRVVHLKSCATKRRSYEGKGFLYSTVDGSEIPFPTTWDVKNLVNDGINYQPQMVQDFFQQRYDKVCAVLILLK